MTDNDLYKGLIYYNKKNKCYYKYIIHRFNGNEEIRYYFRKLNNDFTPYIFKKPTVSVFTEKDLIYFIPRWILREQNKLEENTCD